MPDSRPVQPCENPGAADLRVLVALGREEPPPIPEPVFVEPAYQGGAWTDGTDPA